jgi:hypothetical protein
LPLINLGKNFVRSTEKFDAALGPSLWEAEPTQIREVWELAPLWSRYLWECGFGAFGDVTG